MKALEKALHAYVFLWVRSCRCVPQKWLSEEVLLWYACAPQKRVARCHAIAEELSVNFSLPVVFPQLLLNLSCTWASCDNQSDVVSVRIMLKDQQPVLIPPGFGSLCFKKTTQSSFA